MRIRKKKHLAERLNGVSDMVIVPIRDIPNVKEAVKNKAYFNYKEIFGNDNPIELEVGCGKGGFIIKKATENPNVNFIAVELLENIIVMAAEAAKKQGLKNLKFVNSGAEYLPRYVKENSVSNVYLNFSPPYPQKGCESRRLSSDAFVKGYKDYLVSGGAVYQKTDDKEFFEYSFSKFLEHGFYVEDISEDIESGKISNVMTEYESKFRKLGMKVYALKAVKK